ncbi:hypothetical protein AAF712_012403 [Marasmius tenuissimus]|uniref:Uncharacterized protein n=1 Tax=Marasmius tenuissimus TaxID=585030 RepID=A0ABR2ZGM7_9AGAR
MSRKPASQAEDDPRAHNYMKFSYGRDDRKKLIWMIRDTNNPAPDPVLSNTEHDVTRALDSQAEDSAVSPSNFFSAGVTKSNSNLDINGPLNTTGGVYWTSNTKEAMKCPPAKRPPRYDYEPGTIWVNNVLPSDGKEAFRQAFVWSAHEEWVDVPGQPIEGGSAVFPHPQHADSWFEMEIGGPPKWLKYDTITRKNKRKRNEEKEDPEVIAAASATKRSKVAIDPNPVGRAPREATPFRFTDPAPSTKRPRTRPTNSKNTTVLVPNSGGTL